MTVPVKNVRAKVILHEEFHTRIVHYNKELWFGGMGTKMPRIMKVKFGANINEFDIEKAY